MLQRITTTIYMPCAEGWKGDTPGAGQEAGDAGNVQPREVAEVEFGEVEIDEGLQDLCGCGALECQQRPVVMDNDVHFAPIALHVTSTFEPRLQRWLWLKRLRGNWRFLH